MDRFDAEGARICKPGDVLKIHVTLDADLYPLGKYGAVAYLGDAVIARASMKFLSDDSGEVALTGKGFSS